ncbi:MAG: nicotinamide mononucleotide transporter [Tidjanibacter sp.]|nr:nicotinamide mononucleotide transporter [Tidjanibacter sp.]
MEKLGIKGSFGQLTRFEWGLWLCSLAVVTGSFLLAPNTDYLNLATSLIGVTGLIFLAKGMMLGQIVTIIFSFLYSLVAYFYHYYGEVITYACMTLPMAVVAFVQWTRNPYKDSGEVAVAKVSARQMMIMSLLAVVVTVLFYHILHLLSTPNLLVSTISITTSFVAVYLTALRSPLYALAYALNDVVLVVLWVLATIEDSSYAPMIACFVMFLINDIYGYINWKRMQKRQSEN